MTEKEKIYAVSDFYNFLSKALVNPNTLTGNSGELTSKIHQLRFLSDDKTREIHRATHSILKITAPPYKNSQTALKEIEAAVLTIPKNTPAARAATEREIREMANGTYVNRVKTSDKQQKAVLDFVKG